jgi:RNA polymerase sigma-70 factor (ECF subfamily)
LEGIGAITQVLRAHPAGGPALVDALFPLVLNELQHLARGHLARERPGHTLQPTALVNELYLKLRAAGGIPAEGRAAFFGVASRVMRQLLIDHARGKARQKRGPGALADPDAEVPVPPDQDLTELEEVFEQLRRLAPRQARIAELRLLAGYTVEEIAEAVETSPRTVGREWRLARAWLGRALGRPVE